jgi:hypothetical protein
MDGKDEKGAADAVLMANQEAIDLNPRFESDIFYNEKRHCLSTWFDGRPMTLRGATKILRAVFYPTYNFNDCKAKLMVKKAKLALLGIDIAGSLPRAEGISSSTMSKIRFAHQGLKLGDIVDKAVNAVINNRILPIETAYELEPGFTIELLESIGLDVPERTLIHVHPLAQIFMRDMIKQGFKPLRAQVPVGSGEMRMGTLIDSMWIHIKSGFIAIIEMKKFEKFYYESFNGQMRAPYQDKVNSPHNQHQIFLGWADWMFSETFGRRADIAIIVRVSLRGIQFYPLEPWVLEGKRLPIGIERLTHMAHIASMAEDTHAQMHEDRERIRAERIAAEKAAIEAEKKRVQDEKKAAREEKKRLREEAKAERQREKAEEKEEKERMREEVKLERKRQSEVKKQNKEREKRAKARDKENGGGRGSRGGGRGRGRGRGRGPDGDGDGGGGEMQLDDERDDNGPESDGKEEKGLNPWGSVADDEKLEAEANYGEEDEEDDADSQGMEAGAAEIAAEEAAADLECQEEERAAQEASSYHRRRRESGEEDNNPGQRKRARLGSGLGLGGD